MGVESKAQLRSIGCRPDLLGTSERYNEPQWIPHALGAVYLSGFMEVLLAFLVLWRGQDSLRGTVLSF